MNDTIFGFVLLLVFREAITVAIWLIIAGLGVLLAAKTDKKRYAIVGTVLAYIAAAVWQVAAIVWMIQDIIHLIELASA